MTQLDWLAAPLPTAPYVPGSATSKAAAQAIRPSVAAQRAVVLGAIRAAGERGLTDEECQRATGLEGSSQRPRRGELQKAKAIYRADFTRLTASGRKAVVWVAA